MIPQPSPRVIPVFTPWSAVDGYDPGAEFGITADAAANWDRLFRQLVLELVQWHMPWLPDALIEAGATAVGAAPGHFEVVLPDGQRRAIPALAAHLQLVPWQLPGELSH